ncbi:MAG: 50S ribosomal protein L29 [Deltaproteobacteria bacterium]|nr:50S ribosomal protein L29 [Deltaproteobacteria bacterium]
MKIERIRELDAPALEKMELSLKGELFTLRVQLATGQLANVKKVRSVKKQIAQVKTIIKEKQLAAQAPTKR